MASDIRHCDVLVAGGGPAGSACAWRLAQAGLDVLVMDAATFPRDKVCAGWITPPVVDELALDLDDYRRGRTLQPITGFRTGLIGGDDALDTSYSRPVSFGIRRCEFDHYLLSRSRARLMLGTRVSQVRRDGCDWVVNDAVRTRLLVGAGGHFCPVARWLNGPSVDRPVVVAQEAEFAIDAGSEAAYTIAPEIPELYFCPDLTGYGWCFRKAGYLNIGFGRLDTRALPGGTSRFVAFLKALKKIPADAAWRWRGHAYRLFESGRRVVADGVLLIGDAAGLAYPQSGEGIRPAIESGLLAAATAIEAKGQYSAANLQPYQDRLVGRFGPSAVSAVMERLVPEGWTRRLAPRLFRSSWFVRRILLNHWFLHTHTTALAPVAGA